MSTILMLIELARFMKMEYRFEERISEVTFSSNDPSANLSKLTILNFLKIFRWTGHLDFILLQNFSIKVGVVYI